VQKKHYISEAIKERATAGEDKSLVAPEPVLGGMNACSTPAMLAPPVWRHFLPGRGLPLSKPNKELAIRAWHSNSKTERRKYFICPGEKKT
jgi:hypothetical protein